ncbi:peptide-methionine (S)-S-oxide reductase [Flavobacterium sp. MAH-1]|uniref:peptide-methionine (S)-S-oxide reductase n=1 Tax=Flavobacterium agri TaxID=2743471 RepID=A0A7Y8Y405_9FLAO|nr:peptide-methionine (S)-S-oxide reductase [Flavobacterium agri]NUY81464.1 peptide-methionine (S)-S-oxide reductase [Flavobacterium agri]NYA71488.1 peptide-methionine (S)-S-oxide reductase [Flavobacterium agri]
MNRIGFGGGCHWCTEAVFQSLNDVSQVQQGWIASTPPNEQFSEAVIVTYGDGISLDDLIEIHLLTHSSTSNHSMRNKYRSAIYYFEDGQRQYLIDRISALSAANNVQYVTQVLRFDAFKENREEQLNYYLNHKDAPFCETYINPKLKLLRERYTKQTRDDF